MGESYNRLALTDARQIDIDGVYGGFPGAWGIRGTGLNYLGICGSDRLHAPHIQMNADCSLLLLLLFGSRLLIHNEKCLQILQFGNLLTFLNGKFMNLFNWLRYKAWFLLFKLQIHIDFMSLVKAFLKLSFKQVL